MEDEYDRHRNVKYVAGKFRNNYGRGTFFPGKVVVRGVGGKKSEREIERGDQNPPKTQTNTHIHTTTTTVRETVTRKGVPRTNRGTQCVINPCARENAGRHSHGPHSLK